MKNTTTAVRSKRELSLVLRENACMDELLLNFQYVREKFNKRTGIQYELSVTENVAFQPYDYVFLNMVIGELFSEGEGNFKYKYNKTV